MKTHVASKCYSFDKDGCLNLCASVEEKLKRVKLLPSGVL